MAKPTTIKGTKLLVLIGNGADPEAFDAPCGINARGIDLTAASSDIAVPDCDDPDAPAWTERAVTTLSSQVTGSGLLAVESYDMWREWFLSGESRNVQIKLDNGGLGHFEGRYILASLKSAGGHDVARVGIDVTLDSDGPVTWVDA